MGKLSSFIYVIAAALLLSPVACMAQYMGTFSQQTVAQTFTGTMTATATHVDVQNLGQAAHSIQVSAGGCVVTLDGSADGTVWYVLASDESGSGQIAFADGFFPHLRITLNFGSVAGCNAGSYTVHYTGYQFPLPDTMQPDVNQLAGEHVTGLANVLGNAGSPIPWQVSTLTCTNPNAAVAYLQVIDATSPVLGNNLVYQVGIPASGVFQYRGPRIVGSNALYFAATTTPNGSTAVSTPVECSVQAGSQVSFLSNQIASP